MYNMIFGNTIMYCKESTTELDVHDNNAKRNKTFMYLLAESFLLVG